MVNYNLYYIVQRERQSQRLHTVTDMVNYIRSVYYDNYKKTIIIIAFACIYKLSINVSSHR